MDTNPPAVSQGEATMSHAHQCVESWESGHRCASRGFCLCECGARRPCVVNTDWTAASGGVSVSRQAECPECGRMIALNDVGEFVYHDINPLCRMVCAGALRKPPEEKSQ